ncbi:MAG: SIS domain-containing protein [Alkalispirochaeta sp.]
MSGIDYLAAYYGEINERLRRILKTQRTNLEKSAELLADAISEDRLIYLFGVGGHSHVGSEEFFYRAGGLANVSPMYDLSLTLAGGGQKSTLLERVEGYGDKVVKAHHLQAGDLLIITSVYGMNACTLDAALEAKRRGCTVVAITSVEAAEATPRDFVARHSSGHSLHEVADVVIDTQVPYGDVTVSVDGVAEKVGGSCNVLQCFCINALVVETVRRCTERGIKPPLWASANVEGGDDRNRALLESYTPRVKYL